MKMIYVSILESHRRGIQALEQALPEDSASLEASKSVFNSMMDEIDGSVGNHERESRDKADRARKLLQHINDQVIQDLEHEAQDDVNDQFIEEAVQQRHIELDIELDEHDQKNGQEATAVLKQMVDYIRSKIDRLDVVDSAQFAPQLEEWQQLHQKVQDPKRVLDEAQIARVAAMAQELPQKVRHSTNAQALLHSAGMPQHVLTKHIGAVTAELPALLHRPQLLQLLQQSKQASGNVRRVILEVKRMANAGKLPNKWLSDAAEAHEALQEDHVRAATPPPVPVTVVPASSRHIAASAHHDANAL